MTEIPETPNSGERSLPSEVTKAQCARCGGERNCDVCGKYKTIYEEHDEEFWLKEEWFILQCRGCEYTFVQKITRHSENYVFTNLEDGSRGREFIPDIEYWPPLSRRKQPSWLDTFYFDFSGVDRLNHALHELYGAFNAGLNMLAAIGIRTCFDLASDVLSVESELPFAKKLDALVESNHIRQIDRERLEVLVDAGSATAHRGWQPAAKDLDTLATILEEFIFDSIVRPQQQMKLDLDAKRIKEAVPKRQERLARKRSHDQSDFSD